jgi:hypothetical protein
MAAMGGNGDPGCAEGRAGVEFFVIRTGKVEIAATTFPYQEH